MTPTRHKAEEHPLTFRSAGHELLGILHLPDQPCEVGLIMLPAGAQYRVGPHRQHVLIARALAERGIASLRYDSSGTADSEGPYRDFDLGPDIDGAVGAMLANARGLKRVVLWGICGSASAILMHEGRSEAVGGMILVNPWVRSEQSRSRTYLKRYYLNRITQADFWRKLLSGGLDMRSTLGFFATTVKSAVRPSRKTPGDAPVATEAAREHEAVTAAHAIQEQMARGLQSFGGRILLIMSEKDLTAQEFDEFTRSSKRWRRLLKSRSIERRDVLESDHLFSRPEWRKQVIDWMAEWVIELAAQTTAFPTLRPERHSGGSAQEREGRRTAT